MFPDSWPLNVVLKIEPLKLQFSVRRLRVRQGGQAALYESIRSVLPLSLSEWGEEVPFHVFKGCPLK